MTTFVTGYDGSDAARAALRWTSRLAGALGADVVAANVYAHAPYLPGKGASDGPVHELAEEARADAERTLAAVDVAEVTHVAVGADSPAAGLTQLAEDQHAALVAVGVTHRGALGRVIIGSVGEKLLHGSPAPVAVVPSEVRDKPIETVGVAYDDRPESRTAVLSAKALADRLGAKLVVLSVNEPLLVPYNGYGVPPGYEDLDRELAAEYGAAIRTQIDELVGADVEVRAYVGSAVRRLTEAAAEVDLLVTGSRGYGAVRGVLLGSVSRHLVDHAPCPVLVLPRGATADLGLTPATATA
jgi:nucleotide-binding universal stress UspA family protein